MLLISPDILQVVSGSGVTLDVHVSWEDEDERQGRQNTNITTATTANVLDLPGSSTARRILDLVVHNKDVSGSSVQIQIASGSSTYVLWSGDLDGGQRVAFSEGAGFVSTDSPLLDMTKYVTADSVHATAATFAGITGLSFPVLNGHVYTLDATLFHITNATTTGAQFAIGGVAATFVILGAISTVLNSATDATTSTGVATAVDTAAIVQTTGAAANAPTWLAGTIQPSESGTLLVKATSEVSVAAGLTVRKGSWARLREVNN